MGAEEEQDKAHEKEKRGNLGETIPFRSIPCVRCYRENSVSFLLQVDIQTEHFNILC